MKRKYLTSYIFGQVPMIDIMLRQKIPKACDTKGDIEQPSFWYSIFLELMYMCLHSSRIMNDYQLLWHHPNKFFDFKHLFQLVLVK